MAAGGKVYASRSSHGRLSASTAEARGSGTGETNRGNLLLNLVANRSIWGPCHLLHIVWKTSGRRDHSVWMVCLAWIACLLPCSAGLEYVGLWESLVWWYTRSRFSTAGHKVGPTSCLLPCLRGDVSCYKNYLV